VQTLSVPANVSPKLPGVRELAKRERNRRIMLAAREHFSKYGYDEATLRGIADSAGLGVGTLFNYVSHKRDLIFLIFNEEIDTLTANALATTRPWKGFRENVLAITDPHYTLFAATPVLSRILLSETVLETPGLHLDRYLQVRIRLLDGMERLVTAAQERGELRSEINPSAIARNTFLSFTAALRWWITQPDPDWRRGQLDYAEMLDMQLGGLKRGITA
jgi:AcrR family transcriptional regulator